jgi:hypothetical protein
VERRWQFCLTCPSPLPVKMQCANEGDKIRHPGSQTHNSNSDPILQSQIRSSLTLCLLFTLTSETAKSDLIYPILKRAFNVSRMGAPSREH